MIVVVSTAEESPWAAVRTKLAAQLLCLEQRNAKNTRNSTVTSFELSWISLTGTEHQAINNFYVRISSILSLLWIKKQISHNFLAFLIKILACQTISHSTLILPLYFFFWNKHNFRSITFIFPLEMRFV